MDGQRGLVFRCNNVTFLNRLNTHFLSNGVLRLTDKSCAHLFVDFFHEELSEYCNVQVHSSLTHIWGQETHTHNLDQGMMLHGYL